MTLDHQHLRRLAEALVDGPFRIRHEYVKDKFTKEEKATGRATIAQDKDGGLMVAYTTSAVAQFLSDCDKTQILKLLDEIDSQKATIERLRAALMKIADRSAAALAEIENQKGEK